MDATRDDMSDNSETAVGLTSWHGTADQCRWCVSSHRHWHGNAARKYLPWLVYMTLYVTFHLFFAMSTSFSHTHLGSELADFGSSSFVAVLRGASTGHRMLNVTIEGQAQSCLGLDSFPQSAGVEAPSEILANMVLRKYMSELRKGSLRRLPASPAPCIPSSHASSNRAGRLCPRWWCVMNSIPAWTELESVKTLFRTVLFSLGQDRSEKPLQIDAHHQPYSVGRSVPCHTG